MLYLFKKAIGEELAAIISAIASQAFFSKSDLCMVVYAECESCGEEFVDEFRDAVKKAFDNEGSFCLSCDADAGDVCRVRGEVEGGYGIE